MFDFGSIFQQMITGISDLFVNQILELISGLFGGLLGYRQFWMSKIACP